MNAQHTPGSWTFSRTPTYWKICHPSLSTMKGPKVLAMVHHTNPNAEHDARLVAAAPDLLAALKLLAASEPLISAATDAELESGLDDEDELVRTQANAWLVARAAIAKATNQPS